MIGLVDTGIGNLRSLERAFAAAGAPVVRTADRAVLARAERLVLPGVGAFGACADALRAGGHDALVLERIAAGVPVLGVCVGMQLLFEGSDERPPPGQAAHRGLGVLPGRVERFPATWRGARLKVPHLGWNEVRAVRPHPVVSDRPEHVYFVHSYRAVPAEASDVLAVADYAGETPAVVGRANVLGVQFHPEKSSAGGLALLRRFAAWEPADSLPAPPRP